MPLLSCSCNCLINGQRKIHGHCRARCHRDAGQEGAGGKSSVLLISQKPDAVVFGEGGKLTQARLAFRCPSCVKGFGVLQPSSFMCKGKVKSNCNGNGLYRTADSARLSASIMATNRTASCRATAITSPCRDPHPPPARFHALELCSTGQCFVF